MSKGIIKRLSVVMFGLAMALCILFMAPDTAQKVYATEVDNAETLPEEGASEDVSGEEVPEECTAWDAGVVSKAATDEEDGTIVYTCEDCGKQKEESIPMISAQGLSYTKTAYNGKTKKPVVVVRDAEKTKLVEGTDYTVAYAKGRTKVGSYKVTVTYKGKYDGEKTLYFTIVPKAPKSASATLYNVAKINGQDDVKFSWKASTGATGYLVYFKRATAKEWSDPVAVTKTYYYKNNLTDYAKYNFKVVPYYQSATGKTKYYLTTQYKTANATTLKKGAGFVTKSGQKYYEHIKGRYLKSSFLTVNKKTYYFDEKGVMKTGWMKKSGYYYYFDRSTGVQKKNCTVDGIKIKKDGKATVTALAKKDIDLMIKARKQMLKVTKPTDTKAQKLKKTFKWVMDRPYKRYRILHQAKKTKGWEITFANDIFDKGRGCCVSEACAFAYLARECGYKTVYICDDTAHAWVEIDGYVYDTLFAVSKSYNTYYKGTYKKAKLYCHSKLKI